MHIYMLTTNMSGSISLIEMSRITGTGDLKKWKDFTETTQ